MTRYFFPASRAHHAYCMAIDFGMEFEQRFGKWKPEGLVHLPSGTEYKLYVHTESLPLMNLREGDFCVFKGALGNEIYDRFDEYLPFRERAAGALLRIIQRNGISFHWPESEAS